MSEKPRREPAVALFIMAIASTVAFCSGSTRSFDILIINGMLVDGTGRDGYHADVGIKDGKIVHIGDLDTPTAKRVVDANGLVVAPGFIDMHTHAENRILTLPSVENYTRQGVTTLVGGNCGNSPYPIDDFLKQVEAKGIAPNLALLVGHNTIRRGVLGTENRAPTPHELEQMKSMVSEAMRQGAFGLSTGLIYIPGVYSETDELVELARVVSAYDGLYVTHMRSEGLELISAVQEAITIGQQANISVHISHKKALGKSMWGKSEQTLAIIDQAVEAGLDITMDQYPYAASSTQLRILFPDWVNEGGRAKRRERLDSPALREAITDALIANMQERAGGDPNRIVIGSYTADRALEGKTIAEITQMRELDPTLGNAAETIIQLERKGSASAVYHCMHHEDVNRIMKHRLVMHASDGSTHHFGQGKPHPRSYGTFPRVLGVYVRENALLTLPEAIYKMTAMPAHRLGLNDRGALKEGWVADIVMFNPQTVMDKATYEDPHQYPEGIPYVLVNGELIIDSGNRTEAFPGKVLYGPGIH